MKKIIVLVLILLASFLVYSGLEAPLREECVEEECVDPDVNPEDNREVVDDYEGKLAIIIDDLGYNSNLDQQLLEIDQPLTVAVLPFLDHTTGAVNNFKNKENFEIILHAPLEPIESKHKEDKMITIGYSKQEMKEFLENSLDQMNGEVKGLNNHKGSKFTSDNQSMNDFLEVVKEKDLFFVDSYTINTSVGCEVAKSKGVPTIRRDVFLDYVDEKETIREKLEEVKKLALENGVAVAIGHHKENTLEVLKEELPSLKEEGIKLVKISELISN